MASPKVTPSRLATRAGLALLVALLLALLGPGCQNDAPGGTPFEPIGEAPARAERIVSLSGHLTEMLHALGVEDERVVGVAGPLALTDTEAAPAALGSAHWPDPVALVALRPDLVVTPPNEVVEHYLKVQGIPYEVVVIHDLLDPVRAIRRLGKLTGTEDAARTLEDEIVTRLLDLQDDLSRAPSVSMVLAIGREPGMFVGGEPFLNSAIRFAEGHNVLGLEQHRYVSFEPEALDAWRPSVVVDCEGALRAAPVKEDRERVFWARASLRIPGEPAVRFLETDALFVPGPRLADGIEGLARALHPERFGG